MLQPTLSTKILPTYSDVLKARDCINGICTETPLLESPFLSKRLGGRLLLKAECLQTTGSFKLRGAANRVAALTAAEKKRGVVARSSGNHGLAIAYCASLMDTSAVVVAPVTAPEAKISRIKAAGARVVQVPMADLQRVASDLEAEEGRVLVPPADDFWIVAGAGTVGLEIAEQSRERGLTVEAVLTCCSGGGLTAGCLLGLSENAPSTRVHAVEAVGFEKMASSLAAGHCVDLKPGKHSICDAINGLYMAKTPFEIIKPRLSGTLAVTDDEAMAAMRVAFEELGLALEPGGAVALAAVLTGKMPIRGKTVVAVLSGRNVDLSLASKAMAVTI
jgi:threonine dehydratase